MVAEPKTITVEPGTELDRLLDEALDRPLVLTRDGMRFRLQRETVDLASRLAELPVHPLPPPTPEQVAASIEGIRQAAGSWKGLVDAEAFKTYIRERRRTKNRRSFRL